MAQPRVPITADTEIKSTILRPWSTFRSPANQEDQSSSAGGFLENGSRKLGEWLKQGINMSFNTSLSGMNNHKGLKDASAERYLESSQQVAQSFDEIESEDSSKRPIVASPPNDLEYVVVYKPRALNRLGAESFDRGLQGSFNLLWNWNYRVPLLPPPVISKNSIESMSSQVIDYHQHNMYPRSGNYRVTANGIWLDVISLTSYDYAHFMVPPSNVSVEIVIMGRDGKAVESYRLSPRNLNLKHQVERNKLTFTLNRNAYVIAALNDHREVVILCDPAETDVPPPSGAGVHNVMDPAWGADNTGKSYATSAFQRALNSASALVTAEQGETTKLAQAIVYVPAGLYLLGNVVLPSNTALYLEAGSVLRFSGIAKDYHAHWHKNSQGRDITWWISTAFNSSNIRIYGRGTIDGNGYQSSHVNSPAIGNNIIVPIACDNFHIEGVIVRDSGSWSITPIRCTNVGLQRVKVLNRLDMGENDCIDFMECRHATVTNCIGISLDDPFTTKTWGPDTDIARSWPGQPMDLEDISFDQCMSWTRCFGFKVGQGVVQPQRNVRFTDCVVYDAAIGLGVNHRWGSAPAEEISFIRCEVERVSLTLVGRRTWFALFTEMGSAKHGVGPVRSVMIEGCKVWDRGTTRVEMMGSGSQGVVQGVVFKNVEMKDLIGNGRADGRAKNLAEIGVEKDKVAWVEGLDVVVG